MDEKEAIKLQEMRRSIRDKIMKSYNPSAVILQESESVFQDMVKAFVILDIADEIVRNIDESQWKCSPKARLFKQVVSSIHSAMIQPYSRMTDDEVMLVHDYAEIFYDKWKSNIDKLFYAIQRPLMDVDTERRSLLCNLLLVSVICEISRQMYWSILKVNIRAIDNASYYSDNLVKMIYKDCAQTSIEDMKLDTVVDVANARNALTNQFRLLRL